jgi:hypothetical protein
MKTRFNLINGEYKASDASNVLLAVINDKINFNNRQIFSLKERFGANTSHYEQRVDELTRDAKLVRELLSTVSSEGKGVRIKSIVEIEVIDLK